MGCIVSHLYYSQITALDLSFKNINELPDLSKYTNLKILDCNNNTITLLNNLPQKLEILNCSNNKITELNNLPQSLKKLSCVNNIITNLDNLPKSLKKLYCSNNRLKYYFEHTLENIRKYNETRINQYK